MAQKGVLRRGSRLGKYRLMSKLGDGGSAAVWLARDTVEARKVALKVVLPAVVEEFGREAVEAEARVAAQLDHPGIARIRNADWIDGRFVLVSDLARSSLDQLPKRERTPQRVLSWLVDVAEGLAHAHTQSVIHRDIKPANILIDEEHRARLADFGTARLVPTHTRFATEVGTFGYMAPEQAYGRPGFASDVFSLSLTAYELFAGVLPGWPFEWPLEGDVRFRKRCPERVQKVIRSGLEIDLAKRFEDGIVFRDALAHALERTRRAEESSRREALARKRRRPLRPESDPFSLETGWFRKRFGRVFAASYDCHACDGPISESMRHCPWCGSAGNSFIEVTRFPLVCPDCERGVRPEWSACPTCSRGRFVSNGRAVPGAATAERRCTRPNCGAPIQRFMHYCPGCKAKVDRPWKVEGLRACARCRWPVVSRWRFCGWCGRKNKGALDVRGPNGRKQSGAA